MHLIGQLRIVESHSEPIGSITILYQALMVIKFCLEFPSVDCLIGVSKIEETSEEEEGEHVIQEGKAANLKMLRGYFKTKNVSISIEHFFDASIKNLKYSFGCINLHESFPRKANTLIDEIKDVTDAMLWQNFEDFIDITGTVFLQLKNKFDSCNTKSITIPIYNSEFCNQKITGSILVQDIESLKNKYAVCMTLNIIAF